MDSSSAAYQAVEALADEFMDRQRAGENPTIGEYLERHPDLADEIREVFPALAVIERIAPASADLQQSQPEHETPAHVRVSQIGDYRILREIGRGGMGVVYEAEQQSLRRRVALKVLPRQFAGDVKALKRFQQEARAAARMHHTNIVPVFEVGDDDEHVFYAMQLIQGQGLDVVIEDLQRLRSERSGAAAPKNPPEDQSHRLSIAGSLAIGSFERQDLVAEARQQEHPPSVEHDATVIAETALIDAGSTASAVLPGQSEISSAETNRNRYYRSVAQIGHQTAGALAYAHARGIIHRDIKPSNLLLDTAGVVWITDFGLAKTGDEALTHTGDILGTIRYMSPERFQGQCDVRADVYSLGLTLYELLVLTPAFSSPDRLKLIEMVTRAEPASPRSIDPRIPRDLETIVLKSIDKDPRRRYQSADDLADDLERFIHDEPIQARRISTIERFGRWARRNKGLAASLCTAALLLVVIAIGSVLAAGYYHQAEQRASDDARELSDKRASLEQMNSELAEANVAIAREAEHAREQELAATQARDESLETQETLRRELYVSDMQEVRQAYGDGAMDRVDELLTKYVPGPGEREKDLRGWEWYFWWRAAHTCVQEFDASPKHPLHEVYPDHRPIEHLLVAPDSNWLAMWIWPGAVAIHDTQTLARLAVLETGAAPQHSTPMAISPDGRFLATITDDTHVRIWWTHDWSEYASLPQDGVPFAIALSSRGLLAVSDAEGHITLWSVEQKRKEGPVLSTGETMSRLAFSPDGGLLATGTWVTDQAEEARRVRPNVSLRIWSVESRQLMTQPTRSSHWLMCLAWVKRGEGSLLVAGFSDGHVRSWDAGTWDERNLLDTGKPGVSALAFSPGAERLAATNPRDNTIHIWEVDSGAPVASWKGHHRDVKGIGFADGGATVWSASADGTLKSWDVARNSAFDRLIGGKPTAVADRPYLIFGADSRTLWRHDRSGVSRWNLDTGESTLVFVAEDPYPSQSRDGRFLVTCRSENEVENRFQVWRLDDADPVLLRDRSLPMAESGGKPDLMSVSGDGSAIAWSSGVNLFRLKLETGHLATGTSRREVAGMSLSDDGRLLGVVDKATRDWEIRFWDVTGDSFRVLSPQPDPGSISHYTGSADESRVAIARWTNEVELYDPWAGRHVGSLRGHAAAATSSDFSPDGRLLATGCADGTVRLFDVEHQDLLAALPPHQDMLHSVAFSPDGRMIASISGDGETRVWHGGTEDDMQDERYWAWIARIHERNGSWELAESAWTEAIRFAPDDAVPLMRRGELRLAVDRISDALADFEAALTVAGPMDREALGAWIALLAEWDCAAGWRPGEGPSWRYTLEKPSSDWMSPDFDDSQWSLGGPRFRYTSENPHWPDGSLWIRRELTVAGSSEEPLSFLIWVDNDVTVFVNGTEAATASRIVQQPYGIVSSAVGLQPGRNVIAARCNNYGGPAVIHVVPIRRVSRNVGESGE